MTTRSTCSTRTPHPLRPLRRVLALVGLLASSAALAQYPSKPIRWVVGFPAGGATDVTARILTPSLGERLGQSFVIDNRPGAHGNIASEIVARATPDGHTLLLAAVSMLAINPGLYAKLAFDPARDFAPITTLVSLSNVIVAHLSLGVSTLPEFLTLARAKPGFITFATSGQGSPGHLAGELLKTMARIDMVHIPYKGGAPAINDVLGGQVHTMIATVPTAVPHVRTGRVKAIAVTTAKRSVALPDVPTIAEAGNFPRYESSNWYGVLAPAATPPAIVARLNAAFLEALALPANRERLLAQGLEPLPMSPAEFGRYLRSEIEKWTKVARSAGVKVE